MGSRGYFTLAQNTPDVDYTRMAYGLALSLRVTQTDVTGLSIGVTPGQEVPEEYRWAFDEIIEIPDDLARGEDWKVHNKCKVYAMTPYEETVLVDADMVFPTSVDDWWDIMAAKDVWASTTALTHRGNPVVSDYYRKTFTANSLPDLYTAFLYFRKSQTAEDLFSYTEYLTRNWERHYDDLERAPAFFSGDVTFAMAAKALGEDRFVHGDLVKFVHMKSQVQDWDITNVTEVWSDHIKATLTPDLRLMVGNFRQIYPFHYFLDDFLDEKMIKYLENYT